MFALGTGLYVYKSFTAENWADIAINIGWGCVCAFTHTKRAFTKYALPGIDLGLKLLSCACAKIKPSDCEGFDDDSAVSEDDHCSIRVIKDGIETKLYSSVFGFVQDLDEHFTEPPCPRRNRTDSDADGDVINVQLSEATENSSGEDSKEDGSEFKEDEETNISNLIKRIEFHTMKFDFLLSQVPTMQTIVDADANAQANVHPNPSEGMHVMKYDGFPRDADGVHFYDRKFVPVDHRMMEIVLQYEGNEYDLDVASPDNFYVAGNKLLDPAFLKWFMLKNHVIRLIDNRN
jgi:hypothetical protein